MRQLWTDLRGNPIFTTPRAERLRTSSRFHHPHHLPTLFYLVQNRAWDDVIRRSQSHPHEVLAQEEVVHNTPLHVACRLDPPTEVIQALQAASRTKNAEGCTPLHVAASHRCSAPALGALLECASKAQSTNSSAAQQHASIYPSSSYQSQAPTADLSRCGRAPIHYACMSFRGLEPPAFKKLLEATLKDGFVVIDNESHAQRLLGLDDFFTEEDETVASTSTRDKKRMNVMTMRDISGHTPLGLLFRRYRERMRRVICTVDRLFREHTNMPSRASLAAAITVHADLGELWERARYMVARLTEERLQREEELELGGEQQDSCWDDDDDDDDPKHLTESPGEISLEAAAWAAEQHMPTFFEEEARDEYQEDDTHQNAPARAPIMSTERVSTGSSAGRGFNIVHASVGLIGYGCPPEMIRLAISIHPNQVKEMDADGNLPIHIAAVTQSFVPTSATNDRTTLAAATAAARAVSTDEDSVISEVTTGAFSFFSSTTVSQTTNPFDKVIKILLQHYPAAARIPQGRTGQLPLVMAMESGARTWDDGLRTLLHAYPPALHNKKLLHLPLYADVMAHMAEDNGENSKSELDLSLHSSSHSLVRSPPRRRGRAKLVKHRIKDKLRSLTTMYELLKTKPDWSV